MAIRPVTARSPRSSLDSIGIEIEERGDALSPRITDRVT
jgi:hypothetical protein